MSKKALDKDLEAELAAALRTNSSRNQPGSQVPVANTQDIRRRIKSIRNTAQITKAMQMVAASKMRKAQQHALAGRPYAGLMNRVLVSLQQRTDPKLHPLLQIREVKKELVVVISTDKGLAGALNTNLFREAANFDPRKPFTSSSVARRVSFLPGRAAKCSRISN